MPDDIYALLIYPREQLETLSPPQQIALLDSDAGVGVRKKLAQIHWQLPEAARFDRWTEYVFIGHLSSQEAVLNKLTDARKFRYVELHATATDNDAFSDEGQLVGFDATEYSEHFLLPARQLLFLVDRIDHLKNHYEHPKTDNKTIKNRSYRRRKQLEASAMYALRCVLGDI